MERKESSLSFQPGLTGAARVEAGTGSDIPRENLHVFISASGKIQDYDFVLSHFWRAANQFGQCVRGFQRRNNSLDSRKRTRGLDSLFVAYCRVFRAAKV